MRQERQRILFVGFAMQYQSYLSIEDVFSIQGKRGKVTFHHEYRCLHLYHQFVPTIDSSREGHDQLQR